MDDCHRAIAAILQQAQNLVSGRPDSGMLPPVDLGEASSRSLAYVCGAIYQLDVKKRAGGVFAKRSVGATSSAVDQSGVKCASSCFSRFGAP
jgi:hypothetical protein